MKKNIMTIDKIFERLMSEVAPLPCQQDYARELCAIVGYHYQKNALMDAGFTPEDLPYQGSVVVAPTGMGKTFLLKALGKILDINIITIDSSTLAHEGWKGSGLSQQLYSNHEAVKNETKWSKSILFLDEIDKIKLWGDSNDHGNPMDNILNLYNSDFIMAQDESNNAHRLDISRFTVILGGAFDGLEEIIKKRVAPVSSTMGFSGSLVSKNDDKPKSEYIKHVTMEDLREYGFMGELLGRISSVMTIPQMQLEDYRCLLNAEHGSIAYRYKTFFYYAYGVDFEIDESAVALIAEKCTKSDAGARSVNPFVNDVLRKSFIVIERNPRINKVVLTADEENCSVRYEYGERKKTLYEPEGELAETICKKKGEKNFFIEGECLEEISNQLLDIFEGSEPTDKQREELTAFLPLALYYIYFHTAHNDMQFSSLKSMAMTTYKISEEQKSTLDVLVDNCLKGGDKDIEKYYLQFINLWHKHISRDLQQSLSYIEEFYAKERKGETIRFKLNIKTN